MKLVLDTNVFANKEFCNWLRQHDEVEKVLPCIAYMELMHHYLKRGKTGDFTNRFLDVRGVVVAPLDIKTAGTAAQAATKRWDFKEKARDYTIGATALAHGAKLVTYNKKDFGWLPSGDVISPEKLIKKGGIVTVI
jgi:predicted nucleic acid-binding protein